MRTDPAAFKEWVATQMRTKDTEGKTLLRNKKKPEWKNFKVPDIGYYRKLVQQMVDDYKHHCPVCLHPDLVFLAESGVWQASKDKMKPGLPYGLNEQVLRFCCTCCNK